jgi:hypothetical protein
MNLTIHVHLMLRVSMHRAVLPLAHVPSWLAQGQFCFSLSECRATEIYVFSFVKAFAC